MAGANGLFFPLLLVVGILNGFLDAIIIFVKNTIPYKIFSGIFGFIFTVFLLFLSLILHLPDILVDYFIYGEGGGGLEAGGWFAFNFSLLIYFAVSLIIGFPAGIMMISHKEEGKDDKK
jgi:hypothetical protein